MNSEMPDTTQAQPPWAEDQAQSPVYVQINDVVQIGSHWYYVRKFSNKGDLVLRRLRPEQYARVAYKDAAMASSSEDV